MLSFHFIFLSLQSITLYIYIKLIYTMKIEGGVGEYSKDFSLNERLLACVIYKAVSRIINTKELIWRGVGELRLSGLMNALNLSDDMIKNAQLSKSVWDNMSKENKAQIFYSLIDLMDVVDIQLKSAAFVNHIQSLGMTKEKYKDMMKWRLGFLLMDIEHEVKNELGTSVYCNVDERSVLIID